MSQILQALRRSGRRSDGDAQPAPSRRDDAVLAGLGWPPPGGSVKRRRILVRVLLVLTLLAIAAIVTVNVQKVMKDVAGPVRSLVPAAQQPVADPPVAQDIPKPAPAA